jgi:protein tyrosine phosphatase (PTP) superfamily phosphohydrolase (DUF442 family)
MRKLVAVCLLALSVNGCAYVSYVKDPFVDIPAFSQVNEHIYRGGRPKAAGFEHLKSLGIKTIVDLTGTGKDAQREEQRAAEYGFEYVHIPLSVYKKPTDEQSLLFLKAVLDPQKQPVFVHCHSGRDRTGAMIAMYRIVVDGWMPKVAYGEALDHGFWPFHGELMLKDYIHQMKDHTVLYDYAAQHKVKE